MGTKTGSLKDQIEAEVTDCFHERQVDSAGAPLHERVQKTRTRRKSYVMDLRIHSPASLGSLSIDGIDTAPALVRLAKVKGLDVIAVTDFYSGAFIDEISEAARETPLTVIPGVDLRCQLGACNDVILSCLFPESYTSNSIVEFLKLLDIPKSAYGKHDYVLQNKFSEIVSALYDFGGICLPSRIDKTPQRLRAVPELVEEYGFRAFDITFPATQSFFRKNWPKIKFQLFSFSNATALAQVGTRIAKVKMNEPGFSGLQEVVARAV